MIIRPAIATPKTPTRAIQSVRSDGPLFSVTGNADVVTDDSGSKEFTSVKPPFSSTRATFPLRSWIFVELDNNPVAQPIALSSVPVMRRALRVASQGEIIS
jgi:hypothetical protein